MSQIASFYLLKDGQRQELSNGDCSGVVYMAIWDWCESELDLDVRFPAPQTEDTLDCALLERDLAYNMLAALREWDLPELAAEIAPDCDLPTEAVQSGLETLSSHLELVRGDVALLYEMLYGGGILFWQSGLKIFYISWAWLNWNTLFSTMRR